MEPEARNGGGETAHLLHSGGTSSGGGNAHLLHGGGGGGGDMTASVLRRGSAPSRPLKNGGSRQNGEVRTVVELRNGEASSRVKKTQSPVNNLRNEEMQYRAKAKKGPQLFAAVSVSTGCLSYGICMAYTSSAIPSMLAPNSTIHNIGSEEASWMSSLLALGALFGSLSAVWLMDAVGRKASLLAFSVMSLFIGWTLLMAASQAWQLYVGRVLLGLGAGLEITISPVYIHETTKSEMRDVCGSFPQVMTALGIVCCYIMGRSLSWNWLSLAACVFLVPFMFGLYYIPESPPWLVYNDEEDLAFKSMAQIRGDEYDATQEIERIKEVLTLHKNDLHALVTLDNHVVESTGAATTFSRFRFLDILHRSVLHPFIVILVLMVLLQFSGQGAITFYTVQIFQDARSVVDPKDCALIIGITYFVSAILSLILKNVIGRRILMLISELGMAVSQLALGIYFHALAQILEGGAPAAGQSPHHQHLLESSSAASSVFNSTQSEEEEAEELEARIRTISWLPLPLLMLFTVAFNVGMGSLTWVVATEVLPVRSRGWTHTMANVTSNFCWFVVTKTFKDIEADLGLCAPFFCYGGVCIFGLVFIYIFLPETRGKSYEETAQSFDGLQPIMERVGLAWLRDCGNEKRPADPATPTKSPT